MSTRAPVCVCVCPRRVDAALGTQTEEEVCLRRDAPSAETGEACVSERLAVTPALLWDGDS